MAWAAIQFKTPPVLADVLASANVALDGEHGAMATTRSAVLAAPGIDAPSEGATALDGPITGAESLYSAFAPVVRQVVIHPWCEGLNQGVGHIRNLSARNAVNAAAKKLGDVLDAEKPNGAMDVLAMLITGTGYADMAQKLEQVLAVYSDATLYLCARRCAQLATLERDKILLPDAGVNARFRLTANVQASHLVQTFGAVGQAVALGDAVSIAGDSAESDLVAITNKKQAHITAIKNAATNATASFTGGAGHYYFLAGTNPAAASRALLDADLGYEYPLAVCVLLASAPGALNAFKGMLQ